MPENLNPIEIHEQARELDELALRVKSLAQAPEAVDPAKLAKIVGILAQVTSGLCRLVQHVAVLQPPNEPPGRGA